MIEYYINQAWNAALDLAAEKCTVEDDNFHLVISKSSITDLKIESAGHPK
jgi:hypothetical protein